MTHGPTPLVSQDEALACLDRLVDVVIAENLTGLAAPLDAQRDGSMTDLSLLPLRIESGHGAPVRAVATVRSPGRDHEEQP